LAWLLGLVPDTTPLRRSRDYRVLALGATLSGLGSNAVLVALPFQVFVVTHSAALVGLIGAAELLPAALVGLFGGAVADRVDRRRLLLVGALGLLLSDGALAILTFTTGHPPVWLIFALAASLAAWGALEQLSFGSMVASLTGEWLRSALSLNAAIGQGTAIVGPGLGGLMIGTTGVGSVYVVDGLTVVVTIFAALTMEAHRPRGDKVDEPILASVVAGLRFVRSDNAMLGSFVIDLFAMTFGMPRALFVVLSLRVFHSGAAGAGLLYACVAAGATLATLTTGWVAGARWLGRITIAMVIVWGTAIAAAGFLSSLAAASVLFAIAGAADSVSAICRITIAQLLAPDTMRGRVTALHGLIVTGGVRLGDIESGLVASLTSASFSVVSGGAACVASVGVVVLAFPKLAAFDAQELPVAAAP